MNEKDERELEESLSYMRDRFQALSKEIKLPDSLKAEVLKKRLEAIEIEQGGAIDSRVRVVKFPWRPVLGIAACFALVVGSYFTLYDAGNKQLTGQIVMDAPMTGAVPSAFAAQASPAMDAEEGMAEEGRTSSAEDLQMPFAARSAALSEYNGDNAPVANATEASPYEQNLESLETALQVERWGEYLPMDGLGDLSFYSGTHSDEQLFVSYLNINYSRELRMYISDYEEEIMKLRLVDINKPETYDMTHYQVPYMNSVPEALYDVFFSPIFREEDLTEDVVQTRVLVSQETGDPQPIGNFSILYRDDILVEYSVHGITAEELYGILRSINKSAEAVSQATLE